MTELKELYDSSNARFDVIDENTGKLKINGWVARDENLYVNKKALKPNKKKNWL